MDLFGLVDCAVELLSRILLHVDPQTLSALELSCYHLKDVIHVQNIWVRNYTKYYGVPEWKEGIALQWKAISLSRFLKYDPLRPVLNPQEEIFSPEGEGSSDVKREIERIKNLYDCYLGRLEVRHSFRKWNHVGVVDSLLKGTYYHEIREDTNCIDYIVSDHREYKWSCYSLRYGVPIYFYMQYSSIGDRSDIEGNIKLVAEITEPLLCFQRGSETVKTYVIIYDNELLKQNAAYIKQILLNEKESIDDFYTYLYMACFAPTTKSSYFQSDFKTHVNEEDFMDDLIEQFGYWNSRAGPKFHFKVDNTSVAKRVYHYERYHSYSPTFSDDDDYETLLDVSMSESEDNTSGSQPYPYRSQ